MNANTGTDERRYAFILIDNEVVDDFKLGPHAGWLYVVILRFINQKTGEAFPGLATLAKKAGMSEPTVIKYLVVLKDAGLIAVDPQLDEQTGAHKANHYRALPVKKKAKKQGRVVKQFNQGGKAALPGVVKELYNNNTESEQDRSTKRLKDSADAPTAVSAGEPQTSPGDPPEKKPLTAQQAMFQAVCDAWGYTLDKLTPTKEGSIGGVASELVSGHARPDQIPAFKEWLDAKAVADSWSSYTIHAMKTYWPDYAATLPPDSPPPGEPWDDPKYDKSLEGLSFDELNQRKLERSLRILEQLKGGGL